MKKLVSFEKELDFPSMIGEITSISLDQMINFTDSSSASGKFIVSGTYKMTEASTLIENFEYNIPVEIALTESLDLDSAKISIRDFSYEIINDDILKCNIDILIEGIEEIVLEEEKNEVEELEELPIIDEEIDKIIEKQEEIIEKENKSLKEEKEEDKEQLVRECDGDLKEENNDLDEVLGEEKQVEEENTFIEEESKSSQNDLPIKEQITNENEIKMKEAEITMNNNYMTKQNDPSSDLVNNIEDKSTSSNISSLFQVFENSEETFTTYSVYIMRKEDTLEKILDTYHVSREQLSEYNDLDNLELGSKIIIPSCNE